MKKVGGFIRDCVEKYKYPFADPQREPPFGARR